MRRFLPIYCCTVIVLAISSYGAAWTDAATHHGPVNQIPKMSIRNFRPVDVSSGELKVTVDYTYPGAVQDRVIILAIPMEQGDSFNGLTADFDELPVQSGTNTVTLAITKRSTGPDFTSVKVRVCISRPSGAILCQNFPYEKTWTNGAAQRCSISGNLSGTLEGLSYPDHAGSPTRVRLRQMLVELPNGEQQSAPVSNRSYTFTNLYAGVTYKVFPHGFESLPRQRTVQCRGNSQHRADFRITRPTSGG